MVQIENGKGIVVSDLHIGQWGSTSARALNVVHQKIDVLNPSLIVLNGDIIEGKDTYGNKEAACTSMRKGHDVVRALIRHALANNPDCQVVYTFGNHDTYHEIHTMLKALQNEPGIRGHLTLEESMFHCRDTLFTHGDLQVRYGTMWQTVAARCKGCSSVAPGLSHGRPDDNSESGWKEPGAYTGIKGFIRQSAVAGISIFDQELSYVFWPVKDYAKAIVNCLRTHAPQSLEGVNRVLMGHIHSPLGTRYQHESGLEFLVTGPSTAKSRNTMYQFTIDDHALSHFEIFTDRKPAAPWRRT